RFLNSGDVMIFAAGTGNPFFTTDTAACLRGIEIDADIVLKATKVEGVYDKDPMAHDDAKMFSDLTYDQVLTQKLGVMDLTAICLCQDNDLPLQIFKMDKPGALLNIIRGANEGTIIS
ncbi:MAG: uridine monophosphate kinase, partial [Pseudomonadales bacterium]|nr:uridine monophosphate kinase [Pseudomonadales bacterium]